LLMWPTPLLLHQTDHVMMVVDKRTFTSPA